MMRLSGSQRRLLFSISLILYAVLLGLLTRDRYLDWRQGESAPTPAAEVGPSESEPAPESTPSSPELPKAALLDVPFLAQAPFAVWDELHQEACEEASLMMVQYYRTGKTFGSLTAADQEIKDLIAWQTNNGYAVDVTVAQLAEIAWRYYRLDSGRVIKNPTTLQLKREIAEGRPVIVPAAGRLLPNPYFRSPGPLYHMVVIKGYDNDQFITNDPGTKRGKGFRYKYQDLLSALHDWKRGDILNGEKAVLVFD